jgi:hypothetical protein
MVCSDLDTSLEGPWTHKAMFWWKDEGRPRQRTYTTKVQRTGDDIPAELVPPDEACWLARIEWKRNQQSPLSWPAWMGGNKPYTRIRWSIAQKLGTGCGVCGGAGVGVMDHDPFTGWLRGMLCDNCNNLIDTCPHITGCRFADYLNNPPAWHLRTAYPGLGKKYHNTRRRLARALDEWDPMLFAEIRRHEHPGQDGL